MQSSSVSAQLKRSFFLINIALVLFFALYLLQAYQLYKRAGESELWVNRTNDILQQVKSAQTGIREMEIALQGFLLTKSPAYKTSLELTADKTIQKINYLAEITKENPEQHQRAITLRDLALQKKATSLLILKQLSEGKISNTDIEALLASGNVEIDKCLSLMENTQAQLLVTLASETKYYSRARIAFSAVSFMLISVFLSFAFYKVRQNVVRKSEAEIVAQQREEKYRALVENAGVTTLIINKAGIIKFVSKNIWQLAGYDITALLGKPFQNKIAKEHLHVPQKAISDMTLSSHHNTSAELQIINAAGNKQWVSCRIFPAGKNGESNEWQVVLWDIEDEKQRQLEFEALETAHKNRLRMVQEIIDNIPSVLYIKDADGTYLMVNKKTEEVFHKPSSDISGKTTDFLYKDVPDRLAVYKQTDQEVRAGKIVTFEEVVKEAEGDRYFWIIKFPLLDEKGSVKYIGVLASDITERKETELKLIESRQEAEQAKAAQEAFLANMSHEIRTPMNGIIGMSNLLMSTTLSEEQKDFTTSIQESARSLLNIINDLLDFSKIRSGNFEFEHAAFKLRDTVRKAIYPLQFKAEEKRLKLNLIIDGNVPEVLVGDPLRLQQIIINLTANALKFTSAGSVDIHISSEKTKDGKLKLKTSVKDTGIGIAADKLDKIFESFAQSKADDARKYGGTGLGLAIVKQLVELQQGKIEVNSTIEKGSVFSFEIPFEAGTVLSEQRVPQQNIQDLKLNNIRILVAEDNLINQKVAENTLSKQGASVTIANNGQEAIQQIRRQAFDIILMDLQMPELDGYKATEYIRRVLNNNIPIVAMTANAVKGEEEKCYSAGMNGYISKPFDPYELYRLIIDMTGNSTPKEHRLQEISTTDEVADNPMVDFSFLQDVADNNSEYMHEVLDIFVNTMPEGLQHLHLLSQEKDFDKIAKQAHFLKSSFSVIKVKDLYQKLADVERIAKDKKCAETIRKLVSEITATYSQAHSIVLHEREKHKGIAG